MPQASNTCKRDRVPVEPSSSILGRAFRVKTILERTGQLVRNPSRGRFIWRRASGLMSTPRSGRPAATAPPPAVRARSVAVLQVLMRASAAVGLSSAREHDFPY
jgi:hypothetical protein